MLNKNKEKCIITYDVDGKILSFNQGCENVFNHTSSEIINKKRVYNLFHNESVLPFIKKFNHLFVNNILEINDHFMFSRKDKSLFLAKINVKKKLNYFILYLIYVDSANVKILPKTNFFDKWLIIIRGRFLMGSIIPLVFSIIWSLGKFDNYSVLILFFFIIGAIFFHIAANTFNDYFDWVSGRDKLNKDYVLFSTGGSRAIDFNLISEKNLLFIAICSFIIVAFSGICIAYIRGPIILYLGLFGAFSVYFYSGYPIHFASRYGLGELLHILCLGPLFIYGGTFSLTGNASFCELLVGLPFGLLITACLIANEYPDSKSDFISKKMNLAVVFGAKYTPYIFLCLICSSFLVILFGVINLFLSIYFLLSLLLLPYGFFVLTSVFKIKKNRKYVVDSCIKSLNLYLYFSFSLIMSALLNFVFL